MTEIKKNISSNLVTLRKINNYKQSEIAKKLNYSDKTISKWETGEVMPSIQNLVELCKLYNVTLDEIISTNLTSKSQGANIIKQNTDKFAISLLAVSAIWILATIVYVYGKILSGVSLWQVFVWAVPASMVVSIVFNTLWGNKKINYVFISILIWTLIASIYLQFLQFNLIPLFFIGIPCQVAILLWSRIKKKSK